LKEIKNEKDLKNKIKKLSEDNMNNNDSERDLILNEDNKDNFSNSINDVSNNSKNRNKNIKFDENSNNENNNEDIKLQKKNSNYNENLDNLDTRDNKLTSARRREMDNLRMKANEEKNKYDQDEERKNPNNYDEENDGLINENNIKRPYSKNKDKIYDSKIDEKQIINIDTSRDGFKDSIKINTNTNESKVILNKEEFIGEAEYKNFLKSKIKLIKNFFCNNIHIFYFN